MQIADTVPTERGLAIRWLRAFPAFGLALAVSCDAPPARQGTDTVALGRKVVATPPVPNLMREAVFPGDTFDLVRIDGKPPAESSACEEGRPAWAFYVLGPSFYQYRAGLPARCPGLGADTIRKQARYQASGDTVMLYIGDGSEEFQDVVLMRRLDTLSASAPGGGSLQFVRRAAGVTHP